jgi:hypothetical protein
MIQRQPAIEEARNELQDAAAGEHNLEGIVMRTASTRRTYRRTAPSRETTMFRREQPHEPAFFGGVHGDTFFSPAAASTTAAIHRKCEACSRDDEKLRPAPAEQEDEKLSRKEARTGTDGSPSTSNYVQSIGGRGQPMPASLRRFYGERMGYDFSGVRVHTGRDAADSAKDIGARAYTYTHHVVFNEGQYRPERY